MQKVNILAQATVLDIPDRAFASQFGPDLQPDLLYIESVLVSTGENLNDDVFLPEEMWKARNSPVFKPMDWEHNTGSEMLDAIDGSAHTKTVIRDNQIVGVMYSTSVVTKDGRVIGNTNTTDQIPSDFHIVNRGVVYKYLFPKVAARIAREAKAGRIFVSMEAWFKGYDYKVGAKIIGRNDSTSFLDPHLKSNGGNGSFKGERVSRILRDITFGGIGFVANPANRDSVIKSLTNANVEVTTSGNDSGELSILNAKEAISSMSDKETDMSEKAVQALEKVRELEKTLATRDSELAALKVESEKLSSTVDLFSASLASGAENLAKLIGDKVADKIAKAKATDYMGILHGGVEDVVKNLKAVETKLAEADAKMVALETAKTLAEVTSVVDTIFSGVADKTKVAALRERVIKLAASMVGSDRDSYLADVRDMLGVAAMPPWLKDKEKDKEDEKDKKKKQDAAEAEVLETLTTHASLPAGGDVAPPADLTERMKSLATFLVVNGKADRGGKK